jgi:hypothetical protein
MTKPSATDQIVQFRAQSMSNNQIVQQLQQQGFSSHDIFEALNMADMKQTFAGPVQAPNMEQPQNPMAGQPASVLGTPQQQFPPQQQQQFQAPQQPMAPPPGMPPPGMPPPGMPPPGQPPAESTDDVEELIEAVIEEKWGELRKSVDKITAWKEKTETKISEIDQAFADLKGNFDKLHQAIIGKIGDYDKNILEVGTQLQAMEKAFSQILPSFTENVNELSRIADKMKKPK